MWLSGLLVFLGGGAGSLSRWLVGDSVARVFGISFPSGTLAVNILGAALLGFLASWLALRGDMSEPWRLMLATGFLGGFTTFSAFTLDVWTLFSRGDTTLAIGYAAVSVGVGVAALVAGMALGRLVF